MDKDKKNTEIQDQVEEAFSQSSFEDKVWVLWNKYKNHTLAIIASIILGYSAYYGITIYQRHQLAKLQAAYQKAVEANQENTFAETHKKEPIAGLIFLQSADEAYKSANYNEALKLYSEALISLIKTPLASRVQFSVAMTKLMNNDIASGKKDLIQLSSNPKSMAPDRAGAAYQLALIELQAQNYAAAKSYLEVAIKTPNAGIWSEKSTILKNTTPEFAD